MTEPSADLPLGRRSRSRPHGDEREGRILATAERLLADRSLQEISIGELAAGAGISRPTFYFYFASKEDVLIALVENVVDEAEATVGRLFSGAPADSAERWRGVIQGYHDVFGRHRRLSETLIEARHVWPKLSAVWAGVQDYWVENTARAIESERAHGNAPAGLPARDIATALLQLNERVIQADLAQEPLRLASDAVVPTLLHLWHTAIYGVPPA
ncbi:TetR/AcrR family transcriptional regulator [Tersicoccus sp. MR15.9]|uniref:TetR/AcrR family transcriptional regulator n=1 Tax=Tersicoccus mangrovi TaxID=3121635 RepID=UPI002FE52905